MHHIMLCGLETNIRILGVGERCRIPHLEARFGELKLVAIEEDVSRRDVHRGSVGWGLRCHRFDLSEDNV